MFEPGLDVLRYKFTIICLLFQTISAFVRGPAPARLRQRPSWDASWFPAVYVWGLESVYHGFGLTFLPSRFCFGIPFFVFAMEGIKTFFAGTLTLAVCFACEGTARRRFLPARDARASLPLGVFGVLLAVQMNWIALGLSLVPLIAEPTHLSFSVATFLHVSGRP